MTVDLNLPAFGLDCRDWLVATEAEGLLADETEAAPVVAVLTTAIVVGCELVPVQAVFSLALLDDDAAQWDGQDICVLEAQWSAGYARFAVPAPGGGLAVVAEFTSAPDPAPELIDRFYDLVTSFHWS